MHFIRLIRPINLIVIALTMYSVRVYFLPYISPQTSTEHPAEWLDYFLLVFSTVLIAAGGNVINDYFDVKADKINKPEKVIIGKYIKPRWAIVSHWMMNAVAFLIACYLSFKHHTFWYVFIHLLSINSLWFYSMYFKRKFFIGNFIIAALTGLVPILSGIYFLDITTPYHYIPNTSWLSALNLKIFFVIAFALFALLLNIIREIIKDVEDIQGDLELKAKTIAIVWGPKRTIWLVEFFIVLFLVLPIPFLIEAYEMYGTSIFISLAPTFAIVIGMMVSLILLLQKNPSKKTYQTVDLLLKLNMIIGCSLPLYWYFV